MTFKFIRTKCTCVFVVLVPSRCMGLSMTRNDLVETPLSGLETLCIKPCKTQVMVVCLLKRKNCCEKSAFTLGVINSHFGVSFPPLFLLTVFVMSFLGFLFALS